MPARHGPLVLFTTLLVLSAAAFVHSSTAVLGQSGAQGASPRGFAVTTGLRGKAAEGLPSPVVEMRAAILEAVRSGRLDDLRYAIELNEIRPVIADADDTDPLAGIRKASADGSGREVLSALGRILESDWAAYPLGRDIENNLVYVWPRFAVTGTAKLSEAETAELRRIAPDANAAAVTDKGSYSGWKIGIGAEGTWHFLVR